MSDHSHECRECRAEIECADTEDTCQWAGGNDDCRECTRQTHTETVIYGWEEGSRVHVDTVTTDTALPGLMSPYASHDELVAHVMDELVMYGGWTRDQLETEDGDSFIY